jgi:hypothetical protein
MDMNNTPDHRYTAEQWVGWKKYADDLTVFVQRRAPFPGEPPAGYVNIYRKHQIFAPIPDEHHTLIREYYGQVPAPALTSTGDVHMPASLLSEIVAKLHEAPAHVPPARQIAYMGGGRAFQPRGRGYTGPGRGGWGRNTRTRDLRGVYKFLSDTLHELTGLSDRLDIPRGPKLRTRQNRRGRRADDGVIGQSTQQVAASETLLPVAEAPEVVMEEDVGPATMTMGNEVMEDEPIDLDGEFDGVMDRLCDC